MVQCAITHNPLAVHSLAPQFAQATELARKQNVIVVQANYRLGPLGCPPDFARVHPEASVHVLHRFFALDQLRAESPTNSTVSCKLLDSFNTE